MFDYFKISKALESAAKILETEESETDEALRSLKEAEMNLQLALLNVTKLYNE